MGKSGGWLKRPAVPFGEGGESSLHLPRAVKTTALEESGREGLLLRGQRSSALCNLVREPHTY